MTLTDDNFLPDDDQLPPHSAPRPPAATSSPPGGGSWDRADYQRIWLKTQSRPWQTLAIVAGDEGMSTYEVAHLITCMGRHYGETIGLADVQDIGLNRVPAFLEVAKWYLNRGQRIVFATRAITENLAAVPLARAADGVILCVSIGQTSLQLVQDTVEQIGKERFIGSILLAKARKGAAGQGAVGVKQLEAQS